MIDSSEVTILTTRTCRWTLRITVALREKGIPFRLINVLENGEKAPWFLAQTPFGKTPVLRHGQHSLPESLVICEYIDETFGGRPLLPADAMQRAWDRVWLRFCDDTLIKSLYAIVRAPDSASRVEALGQLVAEGKRLETFRSRAAVPYWHGGQLTLPDICYFTFFDAMERMDSEVRSRFWTELPHLRAWRDCVAGSEVFAVAARELDALGD